jgi:MFS transporter, DHA2 family, multidrug resistance protein
MTVAETLRRRALGRMFPTLPKRAEDAPIPPASPAAAPQSDAPRLRDWVGILAMGTGLFLAIMDVQIVASSLTQIQGGLSASPDEIAWVQTAYLIADVVMVPMCGFMSRLLSTRVLFVTAALGFTGPACCAQPLPASAR